MNLLINNAYNSMKYCIIVMVMFMGEIAMAHQSNLSTTIFSRTESGEVIMQISSSLTAFQGEINYNNSKNAYKSVEEFRDLVLKHFFNTVSMVLNETETLSFINPTVLLGHETKIVAEVMGIPSDLKTLHLKNEFFKDMDNNQSVVIFSLERFPVKNNCVLNNDNKQELNILFQGDHWENFDDMALPFYLKFLILLTILLVMGLVFYLIRKKRKESPSAV